MCNESVNVQPHQTKRFKRQPIKRVWKPIRKPVANSKPQWTPTGRHFSLFEKYPFTRIMEPTDMPIDLIFTSLFAYKSLFNEVMVMASSVESSEFHDFVEEAFMIKSFAFALLTGKEL
ncbi:hypothetical protein Tco_0082358 [Tanacetum coccineum]